MPGAQRPPEYERPDDPPPERELKQVHVHHVTGFVPCYKKDPGNPRHSAGQHYQGQHEGKARYVHLIVEATQDALGAHENDPRQDRENEREKYAGVGKFPLPAAVALGSHLHYGLLNETAADENPEGLKSACKGVGCERVLGDGPDDEDVQDAPHEHRGPAHHGRRTEFQNAAAGVVETPEIEHHPSCVRGRVTTYGSPENTQSFSAGTMSPVY